MKIKVTLGYDGSKFHGFQIQKNNKNLLSVAGLISKSLHKINIETNIIGSGRTDSNVHATAQVIHFEVPSFWHNLEKLKSELNKQVSPYIYIKQIQGVDDLFHARFSAKKRLYRYILYSGNYQPFLSDYSLHVNSIDLKKLNLILQTFKGIHDFEYFKKTGSETRTNTREIYKTGAYQYKNFVIIYFQGNSFLRSQVRMMSDFSLKVMNNELTLKQLKEQVNKINKHSTGVIPANGLYLSKIYY